MAKCFRCHAVIPEGRRYCGPHYQEALTKYNRQLSAYHQNIKVWATLTEDQKIAFNNAAEAENLTFNTQILGGILGFVVCMIIAIGTDLGLVISMLVGLGIYSFFHIKGDLIKPYARAVNIILTGSLASVLGWPILGFLWQFGSPKGISKEAENFVFDHFIFINTLTIFFLIYYVIDREKSGRNTATAEPSMPTPPSP